MSRRRHQNGFVKPTGKKPRTWTGFWYVYKTIDGQEKRLERSKVIGLRSELTKGEAQEKLHAHIHGLRPEPDLVFETAANNYFALKQGDWSRKNKSVMSSLFQRHIIPQLGGLRIKDIKPTDIKKWINEVGDKYSYSITHKCLTHVRAIFDQLVEDDVIFKNPARSKKGNVRLPKTKKPSERFLDLTECQRLIVAAEDPRDHVLLRILMTCALRPSECFALRLCDVLPGKLRIDEAVVMGDVGATKTEESNGIVPMSPALEGELRAYASRFGVVDPAAYLFPSEAGTPYDPKNYLNRKLKPLARSAKVENVNFQVLRRTCATHFQNFGKVKDTQALLRHTNAAVTLKHYQKTLDESLVGAVAGWDNALTNTSGKVIPIRSVQSA
ncbi:MAG: tyrosine-type recombinase/integrase [Bryobacteraceae bacterium]